MRFPLEAAVGEAVRTRPLPKPIALQPHVRDALRHFQGAQGDVGEPGMLGDAGVLEPIGTRQGPDPQGPAARHKSRDSAKDASARTWGRRRRIGSIPYHEKGSAVRLVVADPGRTYSALAGSWGCPR